MKTLLSDVVYDYLIRHSLREPDVLLRLRQVSLAHPQAQMLSSPDEAQFLAFLVKLIQAKRVIEVGVFTGYTTLALALALPPDGQIIACEKDAAISVMGQPYWREAEVDHQINLRIAPAIETLQALLDEGRANTFDLIFIDADKPSYPAYYEVALELVRPGGLLAIDNTLGTEKHHPFDPMDQSPTAQVLRKFNVQLYEDARVEMSLLPMACGLTLAMKRG